MRRTLVVALVVAFVAAVPSWGARADEPAGPTDAVQASSQAVVDPAVAADVVSLYTQRELSSGNADAAISAAMRAGGVGLVIDGGVLGLFSVIRGGQPVQAAPPGFRYPLSTTVMPPEVAGRILSRDVARVLALGHVVMGQTTASLHGVQVGDMLSILGWDGATHQVVVGLVAPDDAVRGAELLIPPPVAADVALARPSSVVMWGFRSRVEIDQALAAAGLVTPTVRIRRSWDPPDPDGLLSYREIKTALGEFAYAGSGESITLEPGWFETHLSRVNLPLGIRSTCHNVVIPALQGALAEVAAAGLAPAIDVGNTNTFGGCFHAHEITPLGSSTGGFLSRHSWGMAIDMNTVENPEGSPPTMNCDVVRIFRKWGFAWGGNFLQGDGMHFEWVGERRDQWAYPSRYCPNMVTAGATSSLGTAAAPTGRSVLFAGEASH